MVAEIWTAYSGIHYRFLSFWRLGQKHTVQRRYSFKLHSLRGPQILTKTYRPDLSVGHPSHILLASSSEDQQAYERDGGQGGIFTEALLYVLKHAEERGDLKDMTYQTLLDEIKVRFQRKKVNAILPDGTTRPGQP